MARGLKFRIKIVQGLYYPCSENKGADQLRGYREVDLRLCFRICKNPFFSRRGSITEQKARSRSSKAPASTPVSPIQKIVKAPLPKEVWQPRDTPKTAVEEKPAPVKKEISITLLSSKSEGIVSLIVLWRI